MFRNLNKSKLLFVNNYIINNNVYRRNIISISNGGTPKSTQSFLNSKQQSYKTIDNSALPLSLSRFAIDTDQYTQYDSEHKAVITKSIKNGCNVIKSSNESKVVCDVISDLLDKGDIKREELIYIKKTKPLISGALLSDQLSIINLNNQIKYALDELYLNTLDVFLIDLNGISKFEDSKNAIHLLHTIVFPHLEYLVENGTIQSYGISSDELLLGDKGNLSVTNLLAGSGTDKKHFLFLEFPFNLFQNQAITNKIYKDGQLNLIDYLKENKITTLNSSPNQFPINGNPIEICRFEMVQDHSNKDIETCLKEAFNIAIHMETINPIFKDTVQQQAIEKDKDLIGSLQWAHILVYEQNNPTLRNLWNWKRVLNTKINPKVTEAILSVYGNHIMNSWGGNYKKAITQLFQVYTSSLEFQLFQHQNDIDQIISTNTSDNKQLTSLTMLQKSQLLSSIGTDILFESPNTLNQLKSIQTDIKLPTSTDTIENNNLISSFSKLSNNIIQFINKTNK